jgi:hypothetical protein
MFRRLLLCAILAASSPALAIAEAVRPADDAQVLGASAPGGSGAASKIRSAQLALAADPKNPDLAAAYAREAIEQGRANADPRSYGQAQAALAPWWKDPAAPDSIKVLRAVIFQAFHDFRGASAELDAIIAASPRNAQARLSRAFVRMVTGDSLGAAKDCTALPLPAQSLPSQICRARVEALTGGGAKGLERLKRALAGSGGGSAPMQNFAIAVAAEIAASLGNGEEAAAYYDAAIASGAHEAALLAAYADLKLDV